MPLTKKDISEIKFDETPLFNKEGLDPKDFFTAFLSTVGKRIVIPDQLKKFQIKLFMARSNLLEYCIIEQFSKFICKNIYFSDMFIILDVDIMERGKFDRTRGFMFTYGLNDTPKKFNVEYDIQLLKPEGMRELLGDVMK